jgi:hypothetical protein
MEIVHDGGQLTPKEGQRRWNVCMYIFKEVVNKPMNEDGRS